MRILVLSNYYPPYSLGGYEIACETTVNWLRRQGHTVEVLTSTGPNEPPVAETGVHRVYQRIDYLHGGYRQKWQTEKQNYLLTQQALDRFQPDVVYLWNMRVISLGPVYAVEKSKLPRVFEFGDFWPDSYFKPGWKHGLRRLLKQMIPGMLGGPLRLDPVISVADWMSQEIRQKYRSREVIVIPNGLPVPEKPTLPQWEKPVQALFLGRLDPEKGLHLALEALVHLKDRGQILNLTVAGKGAPDYLARCQQFVDIHGLQKQVRFLGWQADPGPLYDSHQILLMPTTMREPFGLVIVEAMLRGLAVFAPAAFGPAEILQDQQTGILFQPGQSHSLAVALERALSQPEALKQVGQRAQHYACAHFALDTVKKRVENVLKQQWEAQTCQVA